MDDLKYYRLLKRINPEYAFRHEVYEEELLATLSPTGTWLDVGCGDNGHVFAYGQHCARAIGLDPIEHNHRFKAPFLKGDIHSIPLSTASVDVVTCHMVVEHLENIPEDFKEVERVLKPGGTFIFLTTNRWSPLIFLSNLLPSGVKQKIISRTFNEDDEDIFPTYHRFNTPTAVSRDVNCLHFTKIRYIEQTSLANRILFWVFLIPYVLTLPKFMRYFRSNILVVYKKVEE